MSASVNATKLTNLVNPEVIGNLLDKKLFDAIKFAPLCTIDTTLEGQPGNTIKLPYWKAIATAQITAEGEAVTINKLEGDTAQATIAKLTNGVELTDEAVLSGYGDPVGQAVEQLAKSIADAVDTDLIGKLNNTDTSKPIPLRHNATTSGKVVASDIADALVKFGEDIDGDKVVVVAPADYANIRKDSAFVAGSDVGLEIVIRGVVGMIHGCVIVVSNRVTAGNAYIIKPGALSIFLKRDTIVESDRDIINKSTVITADKHYVSMLTDTSKAIKIGYNIEPVVSSDRD